MTSPQPPEQPNQQPWGQPYSSQPHQQQPYQLQPYQQQPYQQQPYQQQPYQQPYPQAPYGAYPPAYGPGFPKPTGWFIVNWILLWPLAIYSLVSAWQNIDPAYYRGDIEGARYQAARVRKFGIIALCVTVGIYALLFVAIIVVAFALPDCTGAYCD